MVNKIVRFEESAEDTPQRVLLVADNNDPRFEALNEDLIRYLPPEFDIDILW